jgi:hypothetical protein
MLEKISNEKMQKPAIRSKKFTKIIRSRNIKIIRYDAFAFLTNEKNGKRPII